MCFRFVERHIEVVTSPHENLVIKFPLAASYMLTYLSVLLAITREAVESMQTFN